MHHPSALKIASLFVRTAWLRMSNRSSAWKLTGKKVKTDAPASREATAHRSNQKSTTQRFRGTLVALVMLFGTLLLAGGALMTLLDTFRLREMLSHEIVPLTEEEFQSLREAAETPDQNARTEELDRVLGSLAGNGNWLSKETLPAVRGRFEQAGLAGFEPVAPQAPWRGTLGMLSPELRLEALRAVGLFLLLAALSMELLALGLMNKNLANADPALVWLWQFPVSRPVLFLSKLIENAFTASWVATALVSAVLLWACGTSFSVGLGLIVVFGLAAAFSGAGLRLALEMWLLQKCSRKVRGVIVGVAFTTGNLGVLFVMLFANARATTHALLTIAGWLPDCFFWNPFSLGFGTEAMSGSNPLWWLAAPAIATGLSLAAVALATGLTRNGLACGQDSVRGASGTASGSSGAIGLFRGLVWKELLQIRRQPENLMQVLLAPVVIVFLLYINAPEGSLSLALRDAGTVCVSVFAGAAYLLFVAGSNMLAAELKTLWFLQCQPRPLADCIRTKARVWAAIVIAVCLLPIGWAVAARGAERGEILLRIPCMVAGLWLLAEVTFGLLSLGGSVQNEQTVRIRKVAMWLPVMISTNLATAVYRGDPWYQVLVLSVLVVLNLAVRQKQQIELQWLSEPVEDPPQRLYAMHGVLAVLGFLFVRDTLAPVLALAKLGEVEVITLAYILSALVVSVISWIWLRRSGLTVLPQGPASPAWRPLTLGLLACCLVGFACVGVLRSTGIAGPGYLDLSSQSAASAGSYQAGLVALMIVLVAPLFEEWVFRGLLYHSLRRSLGIVPSVAVTSLLFVALHPLVSSVAVLTLSLVTTLLAERTKRLWPSMLVHVGYNAFVLMSWNLAG